MNAAAGETRSGGQRDTAYGVRDGEKIDYPAMGDTSQGVALRMTATGHAPRGNQRVGIPVVDECAGMPGIST